MSPNPGIKSSHPRLYDISKIHPQIIVRHSQSFYTVIRTALHNANLLVLPSKNSCLIYLTAHTGFPNHCSNAVFPGACDVVLIVHSAKQCL